MRRFLGISGAIFALSGCITADPGQDPADPADPHALEAMIFAAKHTGMAETEIPPIEYSPEVSDGAAFYDWERNRIILGADWQPDREGKAALAHEMTHVLQFEHRRALWTDVPAYEGCMLLEIEAYQVDYAYQASIDPEETKRFLMGFSAAEASEIHARNRCQEITP